MSLAQMDTLQRKVNEGILALPLMEHYIDSSYTIEINQISSPEYRSQFKPCLVGQPLDYRYVHWIKFGDRFHHKIHITKKIFIGEEFLPDRENSPSFEIDGMEYIAYAPPILSRGKSSQNNIGLSKTLL